MPDFNDQAKLRQGKEMLGGALFAEFDRNNQAIMTTRLKEIKGDRLAERPQVLTI